MPRRDHDIQGLLVDNQRFPIEHRRPDRVHEGRGAHRRWRAWRSSRSSPTCGCSLARASHRHRASLVVAHGVVIRESADERRPFPSAMNGMHHLVLADVQVLAVRPQRAARAYSVRVGQSQQHPYPGISRRAG